MITKIETKSDRGRYAFYIIGCSPFGDWFND